MRYRARIASVAGTRRRGLDAVGERARGSATGTGARSDRSRVPPGRGDQPGERRHGRRLGASRARCCGCACSIRSRPRLSFVVQGESRLPPDGDVTVPLLRAPAAERETGGIAISVLGAGEIEKHQMRGLEPADVSELADVIARTRIAINSGLSHAAGRWRGSAVAARLGQALYAAGSADRQRRRGAVSRVSRRRRPVPGRRALCGAQQPAQLPEDHPAAGRDDLERLGGRSAVRPGVAEGRCACCWHSRRAAAGEDAPTFVVRITYLQPVEPWVDHTRAHLELPALDLPISRTGVELLSLAALSRGARARIVSRGIGSQASSRKRCAWRGATGSALDFPAAARRNHPAYRAAHATADANGTAAGSGTVGTTGLRTACAHGIARAIGRRPDADRSLSQRGRRPHGERHAARRRRIPVHGSFALHGFRAHR